MKSLYMAVGLELWKKLREVSWSSRDTGLSIWMLKWSVMAISSSFLLEINFPAFYLNRAFYTRCETSVLTVL